MGQRFLIDTNVIIDYTSGLLPNSGSAFVESILNTDFNISIITKIESLGFDGDPTKMQMLEEFIATANIFQLDEAVAQKTIDLRKRRKMKLGNAIIKLRLTSIGYLLLPGTLQTLAYSTSPG